MTTQNVHGKMREEAANLAVARWLDSTRPEWNASGERQGVIKGTTERPDIVVWQTDRTAVVLELEWGNPATGDAKKRLGKNLIGQSRPITEAIAVGISEECERDTEERLRQRLEADEEIFTVQLVSAVRGYVKVWPERPVSAKPTDLIAYCEYAQVPQAMIEEKSDSIALNLESTGIVLNRSIGDTNLLADPTFEALREATGSSTNEQATQTTCAIWLIAIDLQNDLARHSTTLQNLGLKTTAQLRSKRQGVLLMLDLLQQWRIIESVNYQPVVEIAIESLIAGEMGDAIPHILGDLSDLSAEIHGLNVKHIYNFAGELWQRLVVDREERAAHYTKPEIAEMLASIAAARFNDKTAEELAELKLMDAACGTGTLIGAGERALRRKYIAKGGRDALLHQKRMQEHIYAMDVNGIAGTLTAKRLTDMDIKQDYASSKIAVITDPAGSLILLNPRITGVSRVLGYHSVTPTPGLSGEDGIFHVPLGGIGWVLMNPPYSRPRKGREQATKGLSPLRRTAAKAGYKMSHGQAGLASDFGNLSNIRLTHRGVYSTVLPLTAARAGSWKSWRAELEKDYDDIIAIANVSGVELQSMSADTGMSEMLLVATKRQNRPTQWRPTEILCVNMKSAPLTMAEGYTIAQKIASIPRNQKSGLTPWGNYTRITQREPGSPWVAVGHRSSHMSAITEGLLCGQIPIPDLMTVTSMSLPMTTIGAMADTGPTHHDIGHLEGNDPIGAFEWIPMKYLDIETFQQALWSSDAEIQKSIILNPTHGGNVVQQELARKMVQRRGRWFIKRGLRWTSQAIAIAHVQKNTHGGSAWTVLENIEEAHGRCVALFYNSIFGAITRQGYASIQQHGRAQLQIGDMSGLPCPAFDSDTPQGESARRIASANFDRLAHLELEPFAYCFRDANRHLIDDTVAEMVGLDPRDRAVQGMLDYYRRLFASEPYVNGLKRDILGALAGHDS